MAYPPDATGPGWYFRQAIAKIASGLFPGTLAKGTLLVVEMKTTGTRYVFTSISPSYNDGEQDEPETDIPNFAFAGNMMLPKGMAASTPKFIHLVGSIQSMPCESKEACEAIIAADAVENNFPRIILATYMIEVGDEVEYQANQLLSAAVTVPVTYDV